MLKRIGKWVGYKKLHTVTGMHFFKLRGKVYAFYIDQGIPYLDRIENEDKKH